MATLDNIDDMPTVAAVLATTEFAVFDKGATARTGKATGTQVAAYVAQNNTAALNTTATSLTLTQAVHANRPITLSAAAPFAYVLPQATGTGAVYKFVVEVAATATASTIATGNSTDVLQGVSWCLTTASANVVGYGTTATSKTITLNGTTKGGVVGDIIEICDVETGFFSVKIFASPTGTTVTPFS